MAENKKLQDVMGVTMDKVKGMIDADSIIGKPINLDDGTIIIPVNRVSFLVIKNDSVRVMQINAHPGTVDKLVDSFPDMVDKVSGLVKGKKDETPSV